MVETGEYPECEKIAAVQDKSMLLTEFVDWLGQNGYEICRMELTDGVPDEQWFPKRETHEQTFAKFFGVDLKKAEAERVAMLDKIRSGGKV